MKAHLPIIVVYDAHKVGTAKQCIALASALGGRMDAQPIEIKKFWSKFPTWLWPRPGMVLETPLPEIPPGAIVIGGGRRSAGILAALKRLYGPQVLTIQIFKGDQQPNHFDVLVSPHHDQVLGRNVYPVTGALVWMDSKKVKAEGEKLVSTFKLTQKPYLGVLVGGDTGRMKYTSEKMEYLCLAMERWIQQTGGHCLITTSRRTPPAIAEKISKWAMTHHCPFWGWGEGENPYTGILAIADAFLVTEDSVSMATECAYMGKPLYVFQLGKAPEKFRAFYQNLVLGSHAVFFNGVYDFKGGNPLNEGQALGKKLAENFPGFIQK